jgi:hypothetical protein
VKHPVAQLDDVGTGGERGIHGLGHFRQIVGVDPLLPRMAGDADLVLVAADE